MHPLYYLEKCNTHSICTIVYSSQKQTLQSLSSRLLQVRKLNRTHFNHAGMCFILSSPSYSTPLRSPVFLCFPFVFFLNMKICRLHLGKALQQFDEVVVTYSSTRLPRIFDEVENPRKAKEGTCRDAIAHREIPSPRCVSLGVTTNQSSICALVTNYVLATIVVFMYRIRMVMYAVVRRTHVAIVAKSLAKKAFQGQIESTDLGESVVNKNENARENANGGSFLELYKFVRVCLSACESMSVCVSACESMSVCVISG